MNRFSGRFRSRRERHRSGFSLIELLCVIAIMCILMAFALPAMSSLQGSYNLTRSGQIMVDALSLARQIASSRNRTVEVRIVTLPTVSYTGYSGVQLWAPDSSGASVAMDKLVRFPDGYLINGSTQLSPLLGSTFSGSGAMTVSGSNATYRSFKVRPSGVIEPVQTGSNRSNLYMTVVPGRFASNTAAPPNFMTIQINPDTGTPSVYRP